MAATESSDRQAARATSRRLLVAGATGYIGRHVVRELIERGHEVVSLVRRRPDRVPDSDRADAGRNADPMLAGAELREVEFGDPESLIRDGGRGERFDAVVSCIASRGGGIADSWAVDHRANQHLLRAGQEAGAGHFVLLSAICVQRPELAFQQAKLAFERELRESGLEWSIVRPTAFFKSIAGQVPRVLAGKPYLLLGPGDGPACKPIGESDLAAFMADCLDSPEMKNRVLPIGGPGPAMTVRERGELLFELSGRTPRFRRVPLAVLGAAESVFSAAARLIPSLEDKAEFARIGRYYATQSMLVLDPATGEYDAEATPEYGTQTLADFYRRVLAEGLEGQELGDHAVF